MPGYPHAGGRLNVTALALPVVAPNPKKEGLPSFAKPVALLGHMSKSGDLFSHPPNPGDVRQALIGDCFFLASVASILALPGGSDRILDMMRDLGDGSVVVRFYQNDVPTYVRISKSVLGAFLHNRGSLWLQILEKAYASFKGSGYGSLNGGSANSVFSAFLGNSSIAIAFAEQGNSADRDLLQRCMTSPEVVKQQLIIKVFKGSQKQWDNWRSWLRSGRIPQRWVDFIALKVMVRLEHFMDFIEQNKAGLNSDTRIAIEYWVTANAVLPGKRGTGVYTKAELETYDEIEAALKANLPVAIATPDQFTTKNDTPLRQGSGFSAGEAKYKGLVAKHYYSVVRCEVRGNLKGFVIRNPWGESALGILSYGRSYTQNDRGTLSAHKNAEAEFWIDLSDLSKYFIDVRLGAKV